jgi:hypothetical protein
VKKNKFSSALIVLTLIVACVGAWKAFSEMGVRNRLSFSLSEQTEKIRDLKVAISEARKKAEENSALLESGIESRKEKAEKMEDSLSGKREQVEARRETLTSRTLRKEELATEIQEMKKSIAAVEKEIEFARDRLSSYVSTLPASEAKISEIQASMEIERQREIDRRNSLSTYDAKTNILKDHYFRTLSSLQKYKYDRPWLEKGERLSVSYIQYDFQAGFLGLPVGMERGIEKGMVFSVRAEGRNLCRIKIRDTSVKNSVALIIPLFGNPVELRKYKSFDLIYL